MNTYILIGLAVGLAVVLILIRVVYRKEKTSAAGSYHKLSPVINDEMIRSRAREFLAKGKRIEAIKFVHENSKSGLLESKKFIEEMEAAFHSENPVYSKRDIKQNLPPGNDTLVNEINNLIAGGNKIQAIKLVVNNFNIGLKEAKDFVEAIEANLNARK